MGTDQVFPKMYCVQFLAVIVPIASDADPHTSNADPAFQLNVDLDPQL